MVRRVPRSKFAQSPEYVDKSQRRHKMHITSLDIRYERISHT